ncbi:MAG: NADP-reducing hydrogenase subunit HndC, partial [Cyanobacteriota bacterium]
MELNELLEIAEKQLSERKSVEIRCCTAAACLSSDSQAIKDNLEAVIKADNLQDTVQVTAVGCMRLCCQGPLVQVENWANPLKSKLYEKVTPANAPEIIRGLNGEVINLQEGDLNQPFFSRQLPIVLENSGKIDPERIQAYIGSEGYQALYQVLREMKPTEVVETITKSGLRGRGGAGYPTGLKWATVAKSHTEKKFVICNADEGDPGAFMDRSVLESDPHRILEGMAIAAYAIGANQGYIYVRAEYPLAIKRLEIAIRQAQHLGFLGSQIFDSPFDFKVEIRIGAGAYVCGEETALMASIEGKRGVPH